MQGRGTVVYARSRGAKEGSAKALPAPPSPTPALRCHPRQKVHLLPRGPPPRAGPRRCPLPAAQRPQRSPPRGADLCLGPWRATAGAGRDSPAAGPGRADAGRRRRQPRRSRFEFGARRGAGPVTCRPPPVSGGGGGAGAAGPVGAQGAGPRRAGPIGGGRGRYGCAGGAELGPLLGSCCSARLSLFWDSRSRPGWGSARSFLQPCCSRLGVLSCTWAGGIALTPGEGLRRFAV